MPSFEQLLVASQGQFGLLEARLGFGLVGLCGGKAGFVTVRLDDIEQVAGLDIAALLEE